MNNANPASTQPATRLTWLAAAMFLAFPGAFMAPAVTSDADAAVGQPVVDQSSWETVRVPHAHLSVKVPGTWGAFELSKFPKPSHGTILFARGSGQGDSFIVTRFRGAGAYWFKDFNEFRSTVDASLKLGDAKLLRATKTKVGTRPAYLQIQTFIESNAPVVWGEIDIREKKGSVITIVIDLSAKDPAAQATEQAMFDAVKPA